MSFIKSTGKAFADVIPGLGKLTFDNDVGSIFITSGTGVIGYRVAISLLEAGCKDVRVGIWKGDRQAETSGSNSSLGPLVEKELTDRGATVVDFDWTNEGCYQEAVHGVKTVFCTIPHLDDWSAAFPSFLRACKKEKVEHFIKISFLRKQGFGLEAAELYRSNVPFVKFHGTCDDILMQAPRDSRISYTILCCSHLMSTPLLHQGPLLRKEDKFITASYGMGVNYVSPNDVADAAVVCVLNQGPHRNKVYNLTGSAPITDANVCRLLTSFYGRKIEHIQLGYHEYVKNVANRGLPEWFVRDSAEFERMKATGIDEKKSSYTDDLEKITGRKAETFKDYLTHKRCMRPGLTFP